MPIIHDLIEAENDIERLRELLREGEDPNTQDGLGQTPLHIMVRKGERNPEDTDELLLCIRELINYGANVDIEDLMGCTPLHLATICRNYKMIEILLQANPDINKKDNGDWSALHYAAAKSIFHRMDESINFYETDLSVMKLLLKHNPVVDIRNRMEETPLMFAVKDNKLPIVQELLMQHASVNLQNSHGISAMHYALDRPEVNVNILQELMRYGCSLNKPNKMGRTPKDCFCRRLIANRPPVAIEIAKYILKLFILDNKGFDCNQGDGMSELFSDKNRKFVRFLSFCRNELFEMHQDKLTPHCNVYELAFRGAFCPTAENNQNPIPLEASDKVVDKLLTRQYPVYCDVIATGLCTPYMRKKFAEMACDIKIFNQSLNTKVVSCLSKYLSHFDMLNVIYAYSKV